MYAMKIYDNFFYYYYLRIVKKINRNTVFIISTRRKLLNSNISVKFSSIVGLKTKQKIEVEYPLFVQ